MPAVPPPVLMHAAVQTWVPHLPRLAVESYWRAHPVRADRLARRLAAQTGTPDGWRWALAREGDPHLPASFRMPPAPFRHPAFASGPGRCCICGQPVFRFGWHRDLWGSGERSRRARWHACCVAAWKLWIAPGNALRVLGRLQRRRCALTGARLMRTAEADHILPLFRVWREHRDLAWPDLLGFWGFPNLQAINREAHRGKTAAEAVHRSRSGQNQTATT